MAEEIATIQQDNILVTVKQVGHTVESTKNQVADANVWADIPDKAQDCKKLAADCESRHPVPDKLHKLQNHSRNIFTGLKALNQHVGRPEAMHPNLYKDLGFEEMGDEFMKLFSKIAKQKTEMPMRKKGPTTPIPEPAVVHVNTTSAVKEMVTAIKEHLEKDGTTPVAVDLEAVNLARDGDISVLQIFLLPMHQVFIVDVLELQEAAFTASPILDSPAGKVPPALKSILESPTITKLLWDCRGDNDALFGLYGIKMDGVIDVQLMDCASRDVKSSENGKVCSLDMCVSQRAELSTDDYKKWQYTKHWGEKAMVYGPEKTVQLMELTGGVFDPSPNVCASDKGKKWEYANARPLHQLMVKYCVGDVILLPTLHRHFLEHRRWTDRWAKRVQDETNKRLEQSRASNYCRTENMNKAPDGWYDIKKDMKDRVKVHYEEVMNEP